MLESQQLASLEHWEIKQLISSGAIDASEYPDLDEDFSNPVARAEVDLQRNDATSHKLRQQEASDKLRIKWIQKCTALACLGRILWRRKQTEYLRKT